MRRLFVGRLDKSTRTKDLEDVFESYGKLSRCEIKYGTSTGSDTAYAFVDYERDADAEEALRNENGRRLNGATMVVEWAKGKSRRISTGYDGYGYDRGPSVRDECYRCGRRGHWGRDCPMNGFRAYGRGRSPEYRSRRRYSRSRSRSGSRGRRGSRSRSVNRSVSRSPRRSRSPRQSPPRNSKPPNSSKSPSKRSQSKSRSKSRSAPRQSLSRSRSKS